MYIKVIHFNHSQSQTFSLINYFSFYVVFLCYFISYQPSSLFLLASSSTTSAQAMIANFL